MVFQEVLRRERLESEQHDVGMRPRRPAVEELAETRHIPGRLDPGGLDRALSRRVGGVGGGHLAHNHEPSGQFRQWPARTSTVAGSVTNSGSTSATFSWVDSTGPATTTARVRVMWTRNGAIEDLSNVQLPDSVNLTRTDPENTRDACSRGVPSCSLWVATISVRRRAKRRHLDEKLEAPEPRPGVTRSVGCSVFSSRLNRA